MEKTPRFEKGMWVSDNPNLVRIIEDVFVVNSGVLVYKIRYISKFVEPWRKNVAVSTFDRFFQGKVMCDQEKALFLLNIENSNE